MPRKPLAARRSLGLDSEANIQFTVNNAALPEQQSISDRQIDDLHALIRMVASKNNSNRIDAIKAYRSITGLGLKESKNAIDLFLPVQY